MTNSKIATGIYHKKDDYNHLLQFLTFFDLKPFLCFFSSGRFCSELFSI